MWSNSNHSDDVDFEGDARDATHEIDSGPQIEPSNTSSNTTYLALGKWLVVFLLLIQAKFHLPDKLVELMLRFFKKFLL